MKIINNKRRKKRFLHLGLGVYKCSALLGDKQVQAWSAELQTLQTIKGALCPSINSTGFCSPNIGSW